MKAGLATVVLTLSLTGLTANAQVPNDTATQDAILQALPSGVTPENATADEIAQAALEVVLGTEGALVEEKLTQVMVSLGELGRSGRFENAPRFGDKTPTGRLYNRVLNLASSALDVTYTTYYRATVQHIMALTAAMRKGQNFLNGAQSSAITRK